MQDWGNWVEGLSRHERDQLYPGMHKELIPAYEKIMGMEEQDGQTIPGVSSSTGFPVGTKTRVPQQTGLQGNTLSRSANHTGTVVENPRSYDNTNFSDITNVPPEKVDEGPGDPYSPDERGWHDYETVNLVCPPAFNCSSEQMADFMVRFAFPGQNPNQPVSDGDQSIVVDPRNGLRAGKIRTRVLRFGLEIQNLTMIPHILHDGQITRVASGGPTLGWQIRTHGTGNNVIPGIDDINEWQGPQIFDYVDNLMAAYIRSNIGT